MESVEKIKEIIYVDLDVCMTHDDDGLCQHYCYCYLQNDKIIKRIFDKNVIRKFKEERIDPGFIGWR